jgi:hypothetical protein
MTEFTPVLSTLGGLMIGLAAALMLVFNGRIAGISGIFGSAITKRPGSDGMWRFAFVGGLVAGGIGFFLLDPASFSLEMLPTRSTWAFVVAGLLVGFGTRLGNGCTSGHGVCGLSRFSVRSLVATLSFMGAGVVAVFLFEHVIGGF